MRKIFLFLLVCAAFITISGAAAYLTDISAADNLLHIGNVTTGIEEEFPDPDPVPGKTMKKVVKIKNTGKNNCYVRVQALFSDGDMESLCSVDYNTTDWAKGSDGWWYYKNILDAGKITPPLFTMITIDRTADANKIVPFDLLIRQESRQSREIGTWQDAWE